MLPETKICFRSTFPCPAPGGNEIQSRISAELSPPSVCGFVWLFHGSDKQPLNRPQRSTASSRPPQLLKATCMEALGNLPEHYQIFGGESRTWGQNPPRDPFSLKLTALCCTRNAPTALCFPLGFCFLRQVEQSPVQENPLLLQGTFLTHGTATKTLEQPPLSGKHHEWD